MAVRLFYTITIVLDKSFQLDTELFKYIVNREYDRKDKKYLGKSFDDFSVFANLMGYYSFEEQRYFVKDVRLIDKDKIVIDTITDDYRFTNLKGLSRLTVIKDLIIRSYDEDNNVLTIKNSMI